MQNVGRSDDMFCETAEGNHFPLIFKIIVHNGTFFERRNIKRVVHSKAVDRKKKHSVKFLAVD